MEIYSEKKSALWSFLDLFLTLCINAFVLKLSSVIFKGFYISSFKYALLAALVIMILNHTVKPLLKLLALPVTIITLGILYPFIDVIILKLTSAIIGSNFVIEGWFVPFFISIFISVLTVFIDAIITKCINGGK